MRSGTMPTERSIAGTSSRTARRRRHGSGGAERRRQQNDVHGPAEGAGGRITEIETIKGESGRGRSAVGARQSQRGVTRTAIETSRGGSGLVLRSYRRRRYPVVDTERGIVLSIVRFGLKDGMKSQSVATSNDRLVAEFFAVKNGMIQEIHAVLFNLPDAEPTGWRLTTVRNEAEGKRVRSAVLWCSGAQVQTCEPRNPGP